MQRALGMWAVVGSATKLDAGRSIIPSSFANGCTGHSLDLTYCCVARIDLTVLRFLNY